MTPGNEDLLSQAEKRDVLRNDARVRQQSRNGDTSSYIDHYSPEMGGRFSAEGAATVVGTTPNPYPALPASSPWSGPDPVPPEQPLGYRIDAMPESESLAVPHSVEDTGDPVDAPSRRSETAPAEDAVLDERAGSPLPKDRTND
jgi:hypothetical protein